MSEIAAKNPMYDVIPKHVWIKTSNIEKENYFTMTLEINGEDFPLEEIYIPGLDREEGIHLCSRNLSWLLKNTRTPALDKEKLITWLREPKLFIENIEASDLASRIESGEFDL